MENVVVMIRSCFSVLFFALLLCSVFPVEEVRWVADSMICGSAGDSGDEQACEVGSIGLATESGDDSSQEMQDDCVSSGVSVSGCGSNHSHTPMSGLPPPTLLISKLFHPPTAHN